MMLGIFSFYRIDDFSVSLETDWLAIFVTGVISGLVAWFAAYFQSRNQRENDRLKNLEIDRVKIDLIKSELPKVLAVMKQASENLIVSARSLNYKNYYNHGFNLVNMSSLEAIVSIPTIDIFKLNMYGDTNNDPSLITVYSAIGEFRKGQLSLEKLYFEKLEEYNVIVRRITDLLDPSIVIIQDLIYTPETYEEFRVVNSLPLHHRGAYLDANPIIVLKNKLDKEINKYNKNLKSLSYFTCVEDFMKNLLIVLRDYQEHKFVPIRCAQDLENVIANIDSLKRYYKGYRLMLMSFARSFKAFSKTIENYPISLLNTPDK